MWLAMSVPRYCPVPGARRPYTQLPPQPRITRLVHLRRLCSHDACVRVCGSSTHSQRHPWRVWCVCLHPSLSLVPALFRVCKRTAAVVVVVVYYCVVPRHANTSAAGVTTRCAPHTRAHTHSTQQQAAASKRQQQAIEFAPYAVSAAAAAHPTAAACWVLGLCR